MTPMRSILFFAALGMIRSSALFAQTPSTELDAAQAAAYHRSLFAAPKDAWEGVAWQIDLLAAQHQAATERKPLFVWAMDGHPLTCT